MKPFYHKQTIEL